MLELRPYKSSVQYCSGTLVTDCNLIPTQNMPHFDLTRIKIDVLVTDDAMS